MADIQTLSNEIDALLERYLDLLNTYTTLRTQLNTTQASFHLSLSRANFTSPPNTRYDSSLYPASIQATRTCHIIPAKDNTTSSSPPLTISITSPSPKPNENANEKDKRKNSLLFFSALPPPALKDAQAEAIKVVQEIVPRLCEVDAEMKELEIQIRRARKHRVKAEALALGGEKREEGMVV